MRLLLLGFLTLGLPVLVSHPAVGEEEPEPPAPLTTPFLSEEGALTLLVHPEFRDAPSLLEDVKRLAIPKLVLGLVGPLVPGPDPGKPPFPSRLVLTGPPEAVTHGRRVVDRLDVPNPTVLVSLLAIEVRCRQHQEIGGNVSFDRTLVEPMPDTLFRSVFSQFEPDSYLRSNLGSVTPFQGSSIRFGNIGEDVLKNGAFEYVFRLLAHESEAEYMAWPMLVCAEGQTGFVSSVVQVPIELVSQVTNTNVTIVPRTEETGVLFRVTPIRVGTDSAYLELDAELGYLEPETGECEAATPVRVNRRKVTTKVTVYDQETVLLGGLTLRRKLDIERGLPLLAGVPGLTAETDDMLVTNLILLVRARVLVPGGQGAKVVLPDPAVGEARRRRLAILDDNVRGGVPHVLDRLAAKGPLPLDLLSDGERYAALTAPMTQGRSLHAPTLRSDTVLEDGTVLRFPAGVHHLDARLLLEQSPFPRDLVLAGDGMDRTLLRLTPRKTLAGDADVFGLTLRDLTIDCRNAPLAVTRGTFVLTLLRCRVIGFDRGAPTGQMLGGGRGALRAVQCRFEIGWGIRPGMADLFGVEGPFLARIESSLIRGPLLSLHQARDAAQVFDHCRFVDLPRERRAFLQADAPSVRFESCAFEWLPDGAPPFPRRRRLSELNPNW